MDELGIFDYAMNYSDPRWSTPLGMEVHSYLIRQSFCRSSYFFLASRYLNSKPIQIHKGRPICPATATSQNSLAIASGDLVDLVSSSGSATIYPSDNVILAVLQARFRADLPYTRIGSSNSLVINHYKTLANVNDVSAKVYLLLRRRNESQAVVTRFVTQFMSFDLH